MKRNDWTFNYPAAEVADAADAKVQHHTCRLKFWQGRQDAVMQDVQKDGISVKESAAGPNYTTPGYGAQIMVKPEYQRDLNECHGKIEEHQAKVKEYSSYASTLRLNPDAVIPLDIDDVQFFFGK